MTDHDDAGLNERARQLGAEAEHLYGVTKRRKEALLTAKEQALKVTGEAESRDGSVRATVDVGGMLIELTLTAEASRMKPGDLAGLVTTVTQQAAARAREAMRQIYDSLRDEGIVRGIPVLLPLPTPQPDPPPGHPRRTEVEEEASYEERTITRRSRRR